MIREGRVPKRVVLAAIEFCRVARETGDVPTLAAFQARYRGQYHVRAVNLTADEFAALVRAEQRSYELRRKPSPELDQLARRFARDVTCFGGYVFEPHGLVAFVEALHKRGIRQ